MAGEAEALNRVLDVLRRHELDWLIAVVVNRWMAAGLDAAIANDGTIMAARQLLALTDTVDTALVPEVDALAYLHEATPEALFQDGLLSLDSARPIRGFERRVTSLGAVVTMLNRFTSLARQSVLEEWPMLRNALR